MKKHTKSRAGSEPVSSIMSREFAVVPKTLTVELLTKFLLERSLTCSAVSDHHGALIGHVSMIDLVRERYINGETGNDAPAEAPMKHGYSRELRSGFHLQAIPRGTVGDIMMPFVLRLPESASIDEAAALMAAENVHRVLIVSASDEAVGIVSALDVLRWFAERDGYPVPEGARARWRASCEYAT
jgi:predicted transcriptional regulator